MISYARESDMVIAMVHWMVSIVCSRVCWLLLSLFGNMNWKLNEETNPIAANIECCRCPPSPLPQALRHGQDRLLYAITGCCCLETHPIGRPIKRGWGDCVSQCIIFLGNTAMHVCGDVGVFRSRSFLESIKERRFSTLAYIHTHIHTHTERGIHAVTHVQRTHSTRARTHSKNLVHTHQATTLVQSLRLSSMLISKEFVQFKLKIQHPVSPILLK